MISHSIKEPDATSDMDQKHPKRKTLPSTGPWFAPLLENSHERDIIVGVNR